MTIMFQNCHFCCHGRAIMFLLTTLSLIFAVTLGSTTAFCPPRPVLPFAGVTTTATTNAAAAAFWKKSLSHNNLGFTTTRRKTSSSSSSLVRLHGGLFGLGFAEIGIIGIVLIFVLGPTTIGKIVRASGERATDITKELSRVPDEFKKGIEEGESTARARKARPIKSRVVTNVDDDKEDEIETY